MVRPHRLFILAYEGCQLFDVTGPAAVFGAANEAVCSRRAMTPSPSAPSARLRGSRAAPIAASTPVRRTSCRELLRAVAAYAAGGMKALADLSARRSAGAVRLLEQMR